MGGEREKESAEDNLLEGQLRSIQEATPDQWKTCLINNDTMQPVPYEWNTKYLTPLSYYRNKHLPCMLDTANSEKEATNRGSNSPDSPYLIIPSPFRVHGAQTVSNDLLTLNINL